MLRLKKAISMFFTGLFLGLVICFWHFTNVWGGVLVQISPVFSLIYLILALYFLVWLFWMLFDWALDYWIKYARQTRH
jgi:hypothetical protein